LANVNIFAGPPLPITFLGTGTNDCLAALRAAYGANQGDVRRAEAGYSYVAPAALAHGIDPAILTAIGVRESHFRNVAQRGGLGRGIFQLDLGQNPSAAAVAFNPPAAADYAANKSRQ